METVQKALSKSLKSSGKNEFLRLLDEQSELEEKLTAIYLRAMQPDCFDFYVPKLEPSLPSDWPEEYAVYQAASDKEKPEIWRDLVHRHSGYFKALAEVRNDNLSHKKFLQEMREHFERLKMFKQAEIIRLRLLEFQV